MSLGPINTSRGPNGSSSKFPSRVSEEVGRRGRCRRHGSLHRLVANGVRQQRGQRSAENRQHRNGRPVLPDRARTGPIRRRRGRLRRRQHPRRSREERRTSRQGQGRRLWRLPQGARTQRHRRGEHRHGRSLARQDRHRSLDGRQTRLLREAVDAHARREPANPQRLQEVSEGVSDRHVAARHERPVPPRHQHGAGRAYWATSRR